MLESEHEEGMTVTPTIKTMLALTGQALRLPRNQASPSWSALAAISP